MNINGLFAHTLTDLIRGIRQNKKNEQGYIAKEIADIRLELRRNDPDLKAQAIAKLTYVSQHIFHAFFSICLLTFRNVELTARILTVSRFQPSMCSCPTETASNDGL
jgi:hypothetical protein